MSPEQMANKLREGHSDDDEFSVALQAAEMLESLSSKLGALQKADPSRAQRLLVDEENEHLREKLKEAEGRLDAALAHNRKFVEEYDAQKLRGDAHLRASEELARRLESAERRLGDCEMANTSLREVVTSLTARVDAWVAAAKADGYPCNDPNCLQEICRVTREYVDDDAPPAAERLRIIRELDQSDPVVETSSPKTWDELVARNKAATLDDGFGNMWLKCDRGDCGLHIVRPGKVQCEHEQCPTSHKSE